MKKPARSARLALTHETIRALSERDVVRVVGGLLPDTEQRSCGSGCKTCG